MIQIRQGVFETNSSSTHAISIAPYTKDIQVPEYIKFSHDYEFGWEHATYQDVETKAAYLWVAACRQYDRMEDKDTLLRIKSELTRILMQYGVKTVIFQDADYIKSRWDEDRVYLDINGYIDHGGELDGWIDDLLENPDLVISYLFNNKSQVQTGNDNDDDDVSFTLDAVYTLYKGN